MFSVSADFEMADVEAYIKAETEAWFDELVDELRQRGKEFTNRARAKTKEADNSFGNITWNLRSSIGFCLVHEGKVVESYFPKIKGGTTGQETGAKYAMGEAMEVADKSNIVLVLVAGEHYAQFVSSKNIDVIDSSSTEFEAEITQLWR